MKMGDKVIINDCSEAHGDTGTIWKIQSNGSIIIEFDENKERGIEKGACWYVDSENELIRKS